MEVQRTRQVTVDVEREVVRTTSLRTGEPLKTPVREVQTVQEKRNVAETVLYKRRNNWRKRTRTRRRRVHTR